MQGMDRDNRPEIWFHLCSVFVCRGLLCVMFPLGTSQHKNSVVNFVDTALKSLDVLMKTPMDNVGPAGSGAAPGSAPVFPEAVAAVLSSTVPASLCAWYNALLPNKGSAAGGGGASGGPGGAGTGAGLGAGAGTSGEPVGGARVTAVGRRMAWGMARLCGESRVGGGRAWWRGGMLHGELPPSLL
jgi:hypothetical protein